MKRLCSLIGRMLNSSVLMILKLWLRRWGWILMMMRLSRWFRSQMLMRMGLLIFRSFSVWWWENDFIYILIIIIDYFFIIYWFNIIYFINIIFFIVPLNVKQLHETKSLSTFSNFVQVVYALIDFLSPVIMFFDCFIQNFRSSLHGTHYYISSFPFFFFWGGGISKIKIMKYIIKCILSS